MFFYIIRSIKRRRVKNLITIGISMALVILLGLYFENIKSRREQLSDFAENVPVYCQITNSSGSRETGLFISDRIVRGIENSELTKDEIFMVWLMAGEGEFSPEDWAGNINLYVDGANRVEAVPGLTQEKIRFRDGYGEDFFTSERLECIVNEQTCERRGWKVGDKIFLNLFYLMGDNASMTLSCYTNSLELAEVEIVGTMTEMENVTSAEVPDIVLPFETVREMYRRNGVDFFADTVSFSVKAPLRLNDFKKQMKELGLMERNVEAMDSYSGTSLIVKDDSFISMASDLRRSIEYTEAFLPVIVLVVLVIGYVVSCLLGNSRTEECLLLWLQGAERWKIAMGFWTEQMLLILAGIVTGDILVCLFGLDMAVAAFVDGVLLAAYMTGAAAAYGRISDRINRR